MPWASTGEGIALSPPVRAYYFTDSRYIEAAEKQVAGAAVAVTDRNRNYKAMVQEVIDRCGIKNLGFEEEYMSVAAFHDWKESLTAGLVPAQKLVNGLRAAKDQEEIARMVQAQEITDRPLTRS
jgi:Xaa-Pro aminopeptidase